jgi:hypothetical protein
MIMVKKRISFRLVLACLLLLLLGFGVVWAGGEALPRSLISAGGGLVTQGDLVLQTATGQPVAGAVDNGLVLCSGYWCGAGAPITEPPAGHALFLPTIIR